MELLAILALVVAGAALIMGSVAFWRLIELEEKFRAHRVHHSEICPPWAPDQLERMQKNISYNARRLRLLEEAHKYHSAKTTAEHFTHQKAEKKK